MKRAGCGLCVLAFAASAYAGDHYVEVWNPPEARGTAPRTPATTQKSRRNAPHVVPTNVHRPVAPSTPPKLAAKPRAMPAPNAARRDGAERAAPDLSATPQIPRQITPEGNILQVGTRGHGIEVTR